MTSQSTIPPARPPSAPKANIFLRDKFSVMPGQWNEFLIGKENLLRAGYGHWSLVAGAGAVPMPIHQPLPEPSLPMMHIWKIKDWDTLYDDMYRFTDSTWYAKLETTIRRENQDLLVGLKVGAGTTRRDAWTTEDVSAQPVRVYLYEEVRLKRDPSRGQLKGGAESRLPTSAHGYLRDLNWFAETVKPMGWSWIWSAVQVTGAPGAICLLWEVNNFAQVESDLKSLRGKERYARMLSQVDSLVRQPLYPIATEQLDRMMRLAIKDGEPDEAIVCPPEDLVPIAKR